ncbi:MAG: class I SAM-dependent DNA methyltransferase [Synergistaceae bacterium]|nr:class I SAM-dependent DNA methyltransferase [Synergistaceae bacterium]
MGNIKEFCQRWTNRPINEKSDTQTFWNELLHDVLDVETPGEVIDYEKRVELEHVSFIDGYIPSTGIIIEQKSPNVNLDASAKQSDGSVIAPFNQAKRYYDWLPLSQRGRFIVVSNFREIRIHDMEAPRSAPEVILVSELEREFHKLAFLIDINASSPKDIRELEVSVKAGELVGKLYDALLKRYVNPKDEKSQKSLNIFCVRIVFILYAEDSGLFAKSQFHDYLNSRKNMPRDALRKLFDVLNQKETDRDPYNEDELNAFPYVNGGLFEQDNIEIPQLDGEPLRIILEDMSEGFDWSKISPTIFGAVFESTLNSETRHSGGMHYTSIENIQKLINPLFMDELTHEANKLLKSPQPKELRAFQKKLASLIFFDPACGSGNFLTETFLELRRLENKIIAELTKGQVSFAFSQEETPVQISISQFYGIEVNDFAVAVAKTALWIAEAQMLAETKAIVQVYEDPLPLKPYKNNIIEANALRVDWGEILPKTNAQIYIMGNPPFLGYSTQKKYQKEDMTDIFSAKAAGKIDYVAGWYYKAAEFIEHTNIKAAFVSTNSITQGEQVGLIFKPIYEKFDIWIDFAHTTFIWDSEAPEKAQVHCVVIGFSAGRKEYLRKLIYPDREKLVPSINFYLVPGKIIFVESQTFTFNPKAPKMLAGNRPADGGALLINSREELEELLRRAPKAEKFIKRFMMGYEFINDVERWCLWLVDAKPQELIEMPAVMERIKLCKEKRLAGAPDRQKLAKTPSLFRDTNNPQRYLAIPKTSSGLRYYIPIGWLDGSVIPGDGLRIIPDATLYDFGVLTSRVHMGWMRRVSGRLKSDYSYSNTVVYNPFPWPSPTPKQRAKIEACAQKILDARANNPGNSFAALYNDNVMPVDLRRAHEANDAAVCEAYGWRRDIPEEELVSILFDMYQALKDERNARA